MICVQYDTESETGLKVWIDLLRKMIHVDISVYDPQFHLVVATDRTITNEQAREWRQRHSRPTTSYPDIRLLDDGTAEVIDEVLSDTTPIAYIVVSRFYYDKTANPNIQQFKNGLPIYDESLANDALSLIAFGVQSRLRKMIVVDSDLEQEINSFIYSHMNEKIAIRSLSRALHIETADLRVYLQSVYRCDLSNYLCLKRIEEASRLLATTTLSYSEIADRIGIEETQWKRIFKKQIHMTPEEYRQNNRK